MVISDSMNQTPHRSQKDSSIIPIWTAFVLKFSCKNFKAQSSIMAFPSDHQHHHEINHQLQNKCFSTHRDLQGTS